MAFEEIKENFAEADASLRSYLESSRDYYKLWGFKVLTKAVMVFVKVFAVAAAGLFCLMFLSIAAAFYIGSELDSTSYGFLIVGLFYLLLGLLIYLLRHRLRKPILQKFSEFYFDEI